MATLRADIIDSIRLNQWVSQALYQEDHVLIAQNVVTGDMEGTVHRINGGNDGYILTVHNTLTGESERWNISIRLTARMCFVSIRKIVVYSVDLDRLYLYTITMEEGHIGISDRDVIDLSIFPGLENRIFDGYIVLNGREYYAIAYWIDSQVLFYRLDIDTRELTVTEGLFKIEGLEGPLRMSYHRCTDEYSMFSLRSRHRLFIQGSDEDTVREIIDPVYPLTIVSRDIILLGRNPFKIMEDRVIPYNVIDQDLIASRIMELDAEGIIGMVYTREGHTYDLVIYNISGRTVGELTKKAL